MRQRFPRDAPRRVVVQAFERLGFAIVREQRHIIMVRDNSRHSKHSHYAKSPENKRLDSANYLHSVRHKQSGISSSIYIIELMYMSAGRPEAHDAFGDHMRLCDRLHVHHNDVERRVPGMTAERGGDRIGQQVACEHYAGTVR